MERIMSGLFIKIWAGVAVLCVLYAIINVIIIIVEIYRGRELRKLQIEAIKKRKDLIDRQVNKYK